MIRHRPAHDPAAVKIHDGGQIDPVLIGLDIGDVGVLDPVQRGSGEVAVEQVQGDRKAVAATKRTAAVANDQRSFTHFVAEIGED
jgi:hypothetical protein